VSRVISWAAGAAMKATECQVGSRNGYEPGRECLGVDVRSWLACGRDAGERV
jgi:hypothetical protein